MIILIMIAAKNKSFDLQTLLFTCMIQYYYFKILYRCRLIPGPVLQNQKLVYDLKTNMIKYFSV